VALPLVRNPAKCGDMVAGPVPPLNCLFCALISCWRTLSKFHSASALGTKIYVYKSWFTASRISGGPGGESLADIRFTDPSHSGGTCLAGVRMVRLRSPGKTQFLSRSVSTNVPRDSVAQNLPYTGVN